MVAIAKGSVVGLPTEEVVAFFQRTGGEARERRLGECEVEGARCFASDAPIIHELPKRDNDDAARANGVDEPAEYGLAKLCARHMVHEAEAYGQIAGDVGKSRVECGGPGTCDCVIASILVLGEKGGQDIEAVVVDACKLVHVRGERGAVVDRGDM